MVHVHYVHHIHHFPQAPMVASGYTAPGGQHLGVHGVSGATAPNTNPGTAGIMVAPGFYASDQATESPVGSVSTNPDFGKETAPAKTHDKDPGEDPGAGPETGF